ncbi:MAG: hypothetical protein AB1426_01175 [Bacillota bacterium]
MSRLSFLKPLMAEDELDDLAALCKRHRIGSLEMLDVGLCRLNVEELITGKNGPGDAALDFKLLHEAVDVAKIIGHLLREMGRVEDRTVVLLLLVKAMVVNKLGGCGRCLHFNGG